MNDELLYIWLAGEYAGGVETKLKLIKTFGGIRELYCAAPEDIKECCSQIAPNAVKTVQNLLDKDLKDSEIRLKRLKDYGAELIGIDSEEYPSWLKSISDPPLCLFVKGDKSLLMRQGIAVVGTRRCSPYGRWAAQEIAKKLAMADITVISGMAEGIDAAAHNSCLCSHGKTIAVFGTGIDICFPVSNEKLFKEINDKGLTVSELPPGLRGAPQNFPHRNRIISALSNKVIVVEGAIKSGSMITADLALMQGREVYSVPGNINQPNSYGVNSLIFDGAVPILSIDELYLTLGIGKTVQKQKLSEMTNEERRCYITAEEAPGCTLQYMVDSVNLDAVTVTRMISAMELKGLLKKDGQRIFVIN